MNSVASFLNRLVFEYIILPIPIIVGAIVGRAANGAKGAITGTIMGGCCSFVVNEQANDHSSYLNQWADYQLRPKMNDDSRFVIKDGDVFPAYLKEKYIEIKDEVE